MEKASQAILGIAIGGLVTFTAGPYLQRAMESRTARPSLYAFDTAMSASDPITATVQFSVTNTGDGDATNCAGHIQHHAGGKVLRGAKQAPVLVGTTVQLQVRVSKQELPWDGRRSVERVDVWAVCGDRASNRAVAYLF